MVYALGFENSWVRILGSDLVFVGALLAVGERGGEEANSRRAGVRGVFVDRFVAKIF